jgi:methylated-DNA-protein-cysteine methyltransferase-like protein
MSEQAYQRIWNTVLKVPSGKVVSYGQIADLAGLPGRARLVGKALGCAPSKMKVPWYRVLRSDGKIAFPPGSEHNIKQTALLQQENVAVFNSRVKLADFQWQPDLGELLMTLEY